MKKTFATISLLIVACFLSFSITIAQQDDKSFGYRYRAVFEINDEVGKMIVP